MTALVFIASFAVLLALAQLLGLPHDSRDGHDWHPPRPGEDRHVPRPDRDGRRPGSDPTDTVVPLRRHRPPWTRHHPAA
ncbi:hypothetical protein AB0I55_29100 [Actinocatenispora sera]|uniref:hypothetical protein n=1 Tax=Actinocatenispora sera TaxID=390989 RepID=UPI0033FDADD1